MSLHLEFEPHSWYMSFAIKKNDEFNDPCITQYPDEDKYCSVHGVEMGRYDVYCRKYVPKWEAFTDDGNTYRIVELMANTLKELKQQIRDYYKREEERDKYNRRMIGENV